MKHKEETANVLIFYWYNDTSCLISMIIFNNWDIHIYVALCVYVTCHTSAWCHLVILTLDFSFSIWCSTSSMSSVFSRRSYATLRVPFIRFRGSTDIPYAWKTSQRCHYNHTLLSERDGTNGTCIHPHSPHPCLVTKSSWCGAQQKSNEGKQTHTATHKVPGLPNYAICGGGKKIKMVESIIVLRFIGEFAATILCGYHCLISPWCYLQLNSAPMWPSYPPSSSWLIFYN